MFRHDPHLQFQARPEKPDALFAMKLQEILGGQFGEMTVMMQYLWQGWTCRVPGKYKDMIMDIGTEEIGHVEMLTTMLARLLEGAPAETTEKAVAANPVLAAVIGGMTVRHLRRLAGAGQARQRRRRPPAGTHQRREEGQGRSRMTPHGGLLRAEGPVDDRWSRGERFRCRAR
ncbi:manganese catalase family protein [Micromonospora sp. LAH09]|uniref:manganese catalase family protein n=1 Tax=Micromonospora cabrerizensis TaxID=2911213 RepID=UPI001EE82694|nr:manganese catalase family protein [Micromonospora cabrerizensis]MCG5469924.1 manganese catalase family protein [Micromonospora cabrerizensis]